ncbi:hypothetical protein KHA80_17075 [Anaerobacillus sp. HL2]|nr:hypothetical protein KHA80_17075 [Anaerobacillus sp. HL2]
MRKMINKSYFFFASPEKTVLEYEELLESAGLKPVVADISALSAYRLYHFLDMSSAKDHLMYFQFSINSINVSIFHHHKPVFMRQINVVDLDNLWVEKLDENGELTIKCQNIDKNDR